jgi:hypothetical protein
MAKSLVFGGNVSESLASYDHESSCWRTCQLSLFGEEEKWLDRLPQSGMTDASGKLYRLGCSVRLISVDDGSWSVMLPTPTAKANQMAPDFRRHWKGLLPTPSANEHKYRLKGNSQASRCLEAMARKTVTTTGEKMRLNPLFVEWMMGFPTGWTDLEP